MSRAKCSYCRGDGVVVLDGHDEECPDCDGEGLDEDDDPPPPDPEDVAGIVERERAIRWREQPAGVRERVS